MGLYDLNYDYKTKTIYFSGTNGLFKKDVNTQLITPLFKQTLSALNSFLHYKQSPITKNWYCMMTMNTYKDVSTLEWHSLIYEFKPDFNCRRVVKVFN